FCFAVNLAQPFLNRSSIFADHLLTPASIIANPTPNESGSIGHVFRSKCHLPPVNRLCILVFYLAGLLGLIRLWQQNRDIEGICSELPARVRLLPRAREGYRIRFWVRSLWWGV